MSEPPTDWVDSVLGAARDRGHPLVSVEAMQQRARRVVTADLSGHYVQVPLSLLAWVGRQRPVGLHSMGPDGWRWMCQVQDLETCRECGTVGDADSEHRAIMDLAEHLVAAHGAQSMHD